MTTLELRSPDGLLTPARAVNPPSVLLGEAKSAGLKAADYLREVDRNKQQCQHKKRLRSRCGDHRQERISYVGCGGIRTCNPCHDAARRADQARIAFGIRRLWPAAMTVLSFKSNESGCTLGHGGGMVMADCVGKGSCKEYANRQKAVYERKLRQAQAIRGREDGDGSSGRLEFFSTFEKHKSGALHINHGTAPWTAVPQAVMEKMWGRRVHVNWVVDAPRASREAHKFRRTTPDDLAVYVTKVSQTVAAGRSISFSKGWPKIPPLPKPELEGNVHFDGWDEPPSLAAIARLEVSEENGMVVEDPVNPNFCVDLLSLSPDDSPCTCWRPLFDKMAWDRMITAHQWFPRVRHPLQPWLDAERHRVINPAVWDALEDFILEQKEAHGSPYRVLWGRLARLCKESPDKSPESLLAEVIRWKRKGGR